MNSTGTTSVFSSPGRRLFLPKRLPQFLHAVHKDNQPDRQSATANQRQMQKQKNHAGFAPEGLYRRDKA